MGDVLFGLISKYPYRFGMCSVKGIRGNIFDLEGLLKG